MADNEYDIFIAQKLFPDAKALLLTENNPVKSILDTCNFVIDTNVLLVPYLTGSDSFDQLLKIYQKLVTEKRIFIPGQVAREFVKNRSNKITELYSNLSSRKSKTVKPEQNYHPILKKLPEFTKLLEIEEALIKAINDYQKTLSNVQTSVREWSLNDPVSEMYREIFTEECIFDLPFDEEEVSKKLDFRFLHKIPPGYKDGGKDDKGIGDLLIWLTILKIGEMQKNDLIFITGEEKADWQHRADNRGLFPRFELVDEYRQISGKSFHIISLSTLLQLFEVEEAVIEEIKEYESNEREKDILLDERIVEFIECPYCRNDCATFIGKRKGASSFVKCQFCAGQFHVHRKSDYGAIFSNIPNVQHQEFDIIKEEISVTCPDCGAHSIPVYLGIEGGSSADGYCDSCHNKFHVHRKKDGNHFSKSW